MIEYSIYHENTTIDKYNLLIHYYNFLRIRITSYDIYWLLYTTLINLALFKLNMSAYMPYTVWNRMSKSEYRQSLYTTVYSNNNTYLIIGMF